jgi:hypothetical protein
MALSTRASIDPRWAFHHRPVARGTMLGWGVLLRPVPDDILDWTPNAANPDARTPQANSPFIEVYRGPCRVQSGQVLRSRKMNLADEIVTDNSMMVQLDFNENSVAPGEVAEVHINDVFRVTQVPVLDGVEVEPQLLITPLIVRTISMSTNAWVITLLCDADENARVAPIG